MKKNKYFILLFGYTRIQLFTEINGKIANIDFANGQNKLSNCVSFSYDKEDLEFVPDGDPFEVNKNSSFSDYLDFAGYHFESVEAVETITSSIITNKLIPNLGKSDDIFLFIQAFHYESKEFFSKEGHLDVCLFDKRCIKGHNIYSYDADVLYRMTIKQIRKAVGPSALIGYPFISMFFYEVEDGLATTYAPTMERNVVEKVMQQYPLPTHLPEKLLRNIENRILMSKLLNLPLPQEAEYQNRKVDIAKTNLSKHFDEILKEDARYFLEKAEKVQNFPTIIFDYGMHPVIKESFLSCISKPVYMDKQDNAVFTAFVLRNMMIQHYMNSDPFFKKEAIKINKAGKEETFIKYGNSLYFDFNFVEAYIIYFNKNNIFSNLEFKELERVCRDKIESMKDNPDNE